MSRLTGLVPLLKAVKDDTAIAIELLQEAQADPEIWTFPAMAAFKPFEEVALPVLLFFKKLEDYITSPTPPSLPPSGESPPIEAVIPPGETPPAA